MSHRLALGGTGGVTRQTLDRMKLRGQRSRESEEGRAKRMRETSPPPLRWLLLKMNDYWSVVVGAAGSVQRNNSWQQTISTSAHSTAGNTQKQNYWQKCKQNESKIIFIFILSFFNLRVEAYFFFKAVIWCCYLERYSLQEGLWSILPWFAGREIAFELLNVFY